MYSIMIIIQMFLYNYINKIYIEVEINKYISNKNNVDLYWIICNCTIIILITTINHIINKIGIYNMIEYNICYWLIGTGLGLYISPFIVYGYQIIIYIMDSAVYSLNISNNGINKYNSINTIYNGSNYNTKSIYFISDINNIMSIYRGLNNIMNWAYQMLYYGVRMWLVFVLHSFSLGSFGELISVITDNNNIINVFYAGLLGLGIILYLIVIFYLAIQIYVYISFSLSFLHSTILLLFVNNENYIHNTYRNYSSNINNIYYLIPVSLVDLVNINIIFYIIILYSLLLFFVPLFLANINYTYHYIYKYINATNN